MMGMALTNSFAKGFEMETFTLIVWFVIMGPHSGDFADLRVPGLTEAECKMLVTSVYAGGGRHEWIRTPGLSENLCKAWVALHAHGRAYCEARESPPVCADCRTIKERGRGPA
jgi:hypothetical protein